MASPRQQTQPAEINDVASFPAWEQHFIEHMKRHRDARGWTQTDLARAVKAQGLPGFHQQTIARIENGERPVRLNEAVVIARVYDVDLVALITPTGTGIEMRHTVQRLRRGFDLFDRVVQDTLLSDLESDIEHFVTELRRREREEETDDPTTFDATTLWGLLWLGKVTDAYQGLATALFSFNRVTNRYALMSRTLTEIRDELEHWAINYQELLQDTYELDSWALFSAFPDDEHKAEGLREAVRTGTLKEWVGQFDKRDEVKARGSKS